MAPVSAVQHYRGSPAIGAETMGDVPVDQRTGLRKEAKFAGSYCAFDRQAAEIAPVLFGICPARRKVWAIVTAEAEEDQRFAIARCPRLDMAAGNANLVAGDVDDRGSRMRKLRREPGWIAPMIGRAIDVVGAEAKQRAMPCRPIREFLQ